MSYDYNTCVIGAGVVGLACAARLASRGPLLVIEREWKFGQATSSHNSEVVHAGLYYEPGSLKAKLCVEGNRLIRDLAAEYGIGYQRCGKYIVAIDETEKVYLEWLKNNATASGATDLRWVPLDELREQEPCVRAVAALFSPSTGILDSHGLMAHFKTQAELAGADFVFNTEAIGIRHLPPSTTAGIKGGYSVAVRDSYGDESEIICAQVINAAGLYSDRIAALAGMDVKALDLDLRWTRGFYYTMEGGQKFHIAHLIYPVPDKSLKSLGVHATIDLSGGLRFGPTAEYMKEQTEDYSFSNDGLEQVAESIARYLPGVKAEDLNAMMTGIRPKLTRPGQPARDFYIREESGRGLPGFVNLIGIESPGLTAAPAIARVVAEMAQSPTAARD
jgi:L-2-hydroxyglutarate oxidase LhgO